MKLSVQLVTYNNASYVAYLFESLCKQIFRDWELVVVDNNSTDNTVELIKKEAARLTIPWRLIQNKENSGFAGGHNQAFRETTAEYVVCINPDLLIPPDCFKKLVHFMETHADAAVISPRLMRWNFNKAGRAESQTNSIDSLGLKVLRSRRVLELEAGGEWKERVELFKEVFGVSGTMPLLRRSVLNMVAFADGTIFDETYHSYKEDVDLAFRLRSAGYKAYVVLDAIAYHDRTAVGLGDLGNRAAAENKAQQSEFIKYNSYKNHLATLYKNEYWQNFILDFLWIVWYELKKIGYFLLFDGPVLRGLKELWRNRKDLKTKRLKIKVLRKVGWREMRKWWL